METENKVKKKWKEMNKKEKLQTVGGYIAIGLIWLIVGLFIIFVIKPFNIGVNSANALSLPSVTDNDTYFNGMNQQFAGVPNYTELHTHIPNGYTLLENSPKIVTALSTSNALGRYLGNDGYISNDSMYYKAEVSSYNPYDLANLGMFYFAVNSSTPYPSGNYNFFSLYANDVLKDGTNKGYLVLGFLDSVESSNTYKSLTLICFDFNDFGYIAPTSLYSYKSLFSSNPMSAYSYFLGSTSYDVINVETYYNDLRYTDMFLRLPLRNGNIESRSLSMCWCLDMNLYTFDSSNITPVSAALKKNLSLGVDSSVDYWSIIGNSVPESGVSQGDYNTLNNQYQAALNTITELRTEIYNMNLAIETYRDTQDQLVTALGTATGRANELAEQLAAYERIFANEGGAEELLEEISRLRNRVSELVAINNEISQSESDAWEEVQRLIDVNNSLINSDGEHYQSIYQTGYDKGKSDGYLIGRESVTEEELKNINAIPSTIIGVVGAPVNFFREVLNFSVLGINLFNFICSIVTLFLVAKLIKVVL